MGVLWPVFDLLSQFNVDCPELVLFTLQSKYFGNDIAEMLFYSVGNWSIQNAKLAHSKLSKMNAQCRPSLLHDPICTFLSTYTFCQKDAGNVEVSHSLLFKIETMTTMISADRMLKHKTRTTEKGLRGNERRSRAPELFGVTWSCIHCCFSMINFDWSLNAYSIWY